MKGRLVVIEGIDGAGTETQSKLLLDYLNNEGTPAERLCFPDYKHPIGRFIHEYLHKKFDLRNETLVLLHLADMEKDKEKIKKWIEEGKIVIADRYITSTMAYQGFAGFPLDKIVKLAEFFELPKPDLVIYLKVSAKTSMKRKFKEKNELDRNEENKKMLDNLGAFYEKLAAGNIFGKWAVIDGEKPKEDVFSDVKKHMDL